MSAPGPGVDDDAPPLEVRGLGVRLGRPPAEVLTDLSFRLGPGLTGLVGPNGAGKSTLLRAAAGLTPARGGVWLGGRPAAGLAPGDRARAVAYLAQQGDSAWPLPAAELVALGRLPHGGARGPAGHDPAVHRALGLCGCMELSGRRVDTLSGGERARVLLARALAVEAPLLLCDEPVASLDPYHQLRIMALLRGLGASGVAVVCVLHDLSLAARFCDRLLLLDGGRLLADGPPGEVLDDARLARAYRVRAVRGWHRGEGFVLPWDTLGEHDGRAT